jgi:hypothetical protein
MADKGAARATTYWTVKAGMIGNWIQGAGVVVVVVVGDGGISS